MPEKHFLRQMQALPLHAKVVKSKLRIKEWYEHFDGDVCISFSGGKDSTVLATLVHDIYPDVPMVFCNTGLEYPEIQAFAKKMGAEFVRPKMRFNEVISKYGYPIISKENAEAIWYARKIRNSYSGGGTSLFQGRTGWRRAALTEKISMPSEAKRTQRSENMHVGGGMTDTHRKRSSLLNLRNEFNKQLECGLDGDETALPG